jgi:hypothetical protein
LIEDLSSDSKLGADRIPATREALREIARAAVRVAPRGAPIRVEARYTPDGDALVTFGCASLCIKRDEAGSRRALEG